MTEKDFLSGLTIVIDSRESVRYSFPNHKVEVAALTCGDYSIKHMESEISIEVKKKDLIQSICQNRERFVKELERSRALKYFAIVAEVSLSDLISGNYRSAMAPSSVVQTLLTFSIRYNLPIFFAENRIYGQRLVESLLEKYAREYFKKFKLLNGKV